MRPSSRIAMTVPLLLAVSLAAGCATKHINWDKTGTTEAERQRDENACLRSAIAGDSWTLLAPFCIDRDVYLRCMEARGYTLRAQ